MAEGASIYRIAVEIVGDNRESTSVFSEIAAQLRQIRDDAVGTREALRDMAGGLGAAAASAREFRDAMREARHAAEGAATAAARGGSARGGAPFSDFTEYSGETESGQATGRSGTGQQGNHGPSPGPGSSEITPYRAYTDATSRRREHDNVMDAEWSPVYGIGYTPAGGGRVPPSSPGSSPGAVPPAPPAPPAPPPSNPRNPGNGSGGGTAHISAWDLWYFGKMAADTLVDPAYELAQNRAVLSARLSEAETAAAFRNIARVQQANPATSLGRNTALFNALLSMTQDPAEAAQFLGTIVPYGVALSQINPERGDYAEQLEQVARTAEFLGLVTTRNPDGSTKFDSAATSAFLQRAVALSNLTRGQFTPQALLTFMKRAGPSARELDLNDLAGMFPIVQEQQMTHGGSAASAGTMLLGFNRQFAQGRMSEAAANMLIRMGIIRGGGGVGAVARRAGLKQNPYAVSRGMGNWMISPQGYAPGEFDEIMHHPTEFIAHTLLPAIDAQIAKDRHLPDLTSLSRSDRIGLETNYAAALTSNQPGAQFITAVIANQETIRRELEAAKRAPSAEDAMKALQHTPATSVAAFSSSFSALMATLGSPLMTGSIHALDAMTAALTGLNKAATDHPLAFGGPAQAVASGAAAAAATGMTALVVRMAAAGASFAGLAGTAVALKVGASALVRFIPYIGLIVTGLQALSWLYTATRDPQNAEWLRGHHMGWLAPSAPTQQAVVPVQVVNGKEIASGVTDHAARAIATPHAQSPQDHARSVPQSPGSHG